MAIIDIIKYEGDNTTFVWKHPREDFNTSAKLIVHQTQEAVFFRNGRALDLFGPGSYTLDTENIPLVRDFIGLFTGGIAPFHCEVYFINKTTQMAIRWGTDSKIQYREPNYGFPVKLGASGEMSLRVEDSRKLLTRLVGTVPVLSQSELTRFFRALLMNRIKTYLAQTIKDKAISIFEIDAQLAAFSEELRQLLIPDFAEYGIRLDGFYIMSIAKPDGDPQYEKFKELHFRQYADVADAKLRQQLDIINQQTEAQRMVIDAQAKAQKRQLEGYTYQQERGFDVAEKVAANEAAGQFANLGVGLGTMAGVGGAISEMMTDAVKNAKGDIASEKETVIFCEQCGAKLEHGAKFCSECGAPCNSPGVCPKCGYQFLKNGKFCPQCGAKR